MEPLWSRGTDVVIAVMSSHPPKTARTAQMRRGCDPLRRPREDRDPAGRVFPALDPAALCTAITRACTATGTPHWSPHDLRHRRISLLVLRGTPIPRVAAYVGHARGSMTIDTYAHVLLEASELDYAALIAEPHGLERYPPKSATRCRSCRWRATCCPTRQVSDCRGCSSQPTPPAKGGVHLLDECLDGAPRPLGVGAPGVHGFRQTRMDARRFDSCRAHLQPQGWAETAWLRGSGVPPRPGMLTW